jgi:hypothetical protein
MTVARRQSARFHSDVDAASDGFHDAFEQAEWLSALPLTLVRKARLFDVVDFKFNCPPA